jgi:hypothetical protein
MADRVSVAVGIATPLAGTNSVVVGLLVVDWRSMRSGTCAKIRKSSPNLRRPLQYRAMLEWYGCPFDPLDPDVDQIKK